MSQPGHHEGRHYTEWVEDLKDLKREDRLDEAAALLEHLIDAVEAEDADLQMGVAPWYYEQLAIIRRKQGDPLGEVAILERFAAQRHAPGAGPVRLQERLLTAQRMAVEAGHHLPVATVVGPTNHPAASQWEPPQDKWDTIANQDSAPAPLEQEPWTDVTTYAWAIAFTPMLWLLSDLFLLTLDTSLIDSALPLLVGVIINTTLGALDSRILRRHGIEVGAGWAFLFLPLYLLIRTKRAKSTPALPIVWFVMLALYFVIYDPVVNFVWATVAY